jgi:hypothetical protein
MQAKPVPIRAAVLLSALVLALPVLAVGWQLRSGLVPVFWILAVASLFILSAWSLRRAGHRLLKALVALSLFFVGGLALAAGMLLTRLQHTTQSLLLADGCRVEVEMVGGFGDTDLNVRHRCPVAVLWIRSTPLLWDSEAVASELRVVDAAADGALQVSVTLGRYGKPSEQRTLRIPPR